MLDVILRPIERWDGKSSQWKLDFRGADNAIPNLFPENVAI
jgi:hypothetical protein